MANQRMLTVAPTRPPKPRSHRFGTSPRRSRLPVRLMLCQRCGGLGGTLVRAGGVYVHARCV